MSLINGNFGNKPPEKQKQVANGAGFGNHGKGELAPFPQGEDRKFWKSKFTPNLVVETVTGKIPETLGSLVGIVRLHLKDMEEYIKEFGDNIEFVEESEIEKLRKSTISKLTDHGLVHWLGDSSEDQWKGSPALYLAMIADGRRRGLEYKED